MTMYYIIWGARDPESAMVEKAVTEAGHQFQYATYEGNLCNPRTAYLADAVVVPEGYQLLAGECLPANLADFDAIRIDHHRPQFDPEALMGPDRYLEAASISRVYRLLGLPITKEVRVMAAFDHCFADAVREGGRCELVTPEEVLELKRREIAKGTGASTKEIDCAIAFFREALRGGVPEIVFGGQVFKDLRGFYLGEGYTLDYLAAQVAVAMEGHAALLRHRDAGDPRTKLSVTGFGEPEGIDAFLAWTREAEHHNGVVMVGQYGSGARRYAGAYYPE